MDRDGELRVSQWWGDQLVGVVALAAGEQAALEGARARATTEGLELLRAEGRTLLALDAHGRGRWAQGPLFLEVQRVPATQRVAFSPFADGDYRFFKLLSCGLLCFFAAIAVLQLAPPPEGWLSDDVFRGDPRALRLVARADTEKHAQRQRAEAVKQAAALAKQRDDAAAPRSPKHPKAGPALSKRDRDALAVKSAGLLGAFAQLGDSPVFAPGSGGGAIDTALEALRGGAGADPRGLAGLGSRGSGPGGPGGALSLGGAGTRPGGGAGPYHGIALNPGGKSNVVPEERKVVVDEGLSRELILSVVKRHQSELRFCFEQEAQKNSALAGKVAVAFTIDPAGAVSDAAVSESSLDNANVEACMLARIRRWRFPEPKNGGAVGVNFPWVFKVAGDD